MMYPGSLSSRSWTHWRKTSICGVLSQAQSGGIELYSAIHQKHTCVIDHEDETQKHIPSFARAEKSNTSFKGNNNWATEIAAATSQHKGGLWTAFKCWSQIMVFFTALLILIEPSLSKAAFTKWSGFYQQEQQRQTWRFIKRNKYRGKKEKWTQITKLEH